MSAQTPIDRPHSAPVAVVLARRALQQARRLGAEILVTRSITRIDTATRRLHLDGGDVLRGRTIILACGDRLAGKGIFYGAARSEAASSRICSGSSRSRSPS